MTRLLIIATPSTLSAKLAEIQKQGVVPSGKPITDPASGLPYDLIRDICSGENMEPLDDFLEGDNSFNDMARR